jgi:RND superfamily putative drug exporter
VLVLGAATDYALLLISRYREELRHDEDKYHAMLAAWRGTWEPIAASAGTVAVGLMCLQLSELKSNAGLGPVGAIGVISALIVTLFFLPPFLVLFGRKVFWPFVPKFGSEIAETKGIWGKVARSVGRRPRASWTVSSLVLLVAVAGITQLKAEGISDVDTFTNKDAKPLVGLQILDEHNLVPPATDATIVLKADRLEAVLAATNSVAGVAQAAPRMDFSNPTAPAPTVVDGYAAIDVTFDATESGAVQQQYVADLRDSVRAVSGADAMVGGNIAANYDVQQASRHDRTLIIPVILVVITLILMLLLRSILAPILLVLTVVLSFAATLGVCGIVFDRVLGFPGADASFPLFAFVFLVALGIDYNIFLMTRVREESIKIGTRAGTLKALAVTGGVITSAGIVLAATFAALGILPLVFLAELGFAVAFGVLLDTLLVRSILVPALAYDIDKKIWWPSKLSKVDGTPAS